MKMPTNNRLPARNPLLAAAKGGVAGAGGVRKPVVKKRKMMQMDDAEVQVSERRALNATESSEER